MHAVEDVGAMMRRELGLLTEDEVAKIAGVEVRTVQDWRVQRSGPPFVKWGKATFYRMDSLKTWLEQAATPTGATKFADRASPSPRPSKPVLSVDFDGVLHSYDSGWRGADVIPDRPTAGAIDWLREAVQHFRVRIFSSRSCQPGGIDAMRRWLLHYALERFQNPDAVGWLAEIEFPTEKPPALVAIDDRAVTFNGCWADFGPDRLLAFKPWNKGGETAARNALPALLARVRELEAALADVLPLAVPITSPEERQRLVAARALLAKEGA